MLLTLFFLFLKLFFCVQQNYNKAMSTFFQSVFMPIADIHVCSPGKLCFDCHVREYRGALIWEDEINKRKPFFSGGGGAHFQWIPYRGEGIIWQRIIGRNPDGTAILNC